MRAVASRVVHAELDAPSEKTLEAPSPTAATRLKRCAPLSSRPLVSVATLSCARR